VNGEAVAGLAWEAAVPRLKARPVRLTFARADAPPEEEAPPAEEAAEVAPADVARRCAEEPAASPALAVPSGLLREAQRQLNTCKVIVVGDGRVGKTSLLRRLRGEDFDEDEQSTEGVDSCVVEVREECWAPASAGGGGVSYEEKLAGTLATRQEAAAKVAAPAKMVHPPPAKIPAAAKQAEVETRAAATTWEAAGKVLQQAWETTRTMLQPDPRDLGRPEPQPKRARSPPVLATEERHRRSQLSEPIQLVRTPPAQLFVDEGLPARLEVHATGGRSGEALEYQWHRDGAEVPGESSPVLSIATVTADTGGEYLVEAWCGSQPERVQSQPTVVEVTGRGVMARVEAIVAEHGAALVDDAPQMVVHDFAGQRMYYVLHQVLLTEDLTIYVVTVSLEHELGEELQDEEDKVYGMTHGENLDFWLNSIHAKAPWAKVLLVCTKLDLVGEATRKARVEALREFIEGKAYYDQIAPIRCVSSKTGDGVDGVREWLHAEAKPYDESDGSGLQRYGDRVPLGWFKWLSIAKELVGGGTKRISLEKAVQIAQQVCEARSTNGGEEVLLMLREFADVGLILWKDEPGTRELVVLDVQWMVDQMTAMLCKRSIKKKQRKCPPRSRASWRELQRGRLRPRLLEEIWPGLSQSERVGVFGYMQHFGHCCRLAEQACEEDDWLHIVPTLLPLVQAGSGNIWTAGKATDRRLRVRCIHVDGQWNDTGCFLPDTLYFRLVATLLRDATGVNDKFRDLYTDRVVIRGVHRFQMQYHRSDQMLEVTVHGGDGAEQACGVVLAQIDAFLSSARAEFGIQFQLEPHCELNGELDYHALADLHAACHPAAKLWQLSQPEQVEQQGHQELTADSDPMLWQTVGTSWGAPPQQKKVEQCIEAESLRQAQPKFHLFLGHRQVGGGSQIGELDAILTHRLHLTCWRDLTQTVQDVEAMIRGVAHSAVYLLYLTRDALSYYVTIEARAAMMLGKPVLLLLENDSRKPSYAGGSVEAATSGWPDDLKAYFQTGRFFAWGGQPFEWSAADQDAKLRTLLERCKEVDSPVPAEAESWGSALDTLANKVASAVKRPHGDSDSDGESTPKRRRGRT
jgi:hypothetical protein